MRNGIFFRIASLLIELRKVLLPVQGSNIK
jgi:hypothetical protein